MMTTNNINCPCGSLYLPRGSAFISSGTRITASISDEAVDLDLLHSQDIYLESGEKFVTVTPIIKQHISPNKVSINCFANFVISLQNVIHVVIKDKLNSSILGTQYIGKYNEITTLTELTINLHSNIDLYDNALIIEIYSLCDNGSDPCCDKLPSEINIDGPRLLCVPLEQYYVLPTTTTTTTPEPFTIEFLTIPTNQVVNSESGATFSFSAITIYDKDFTYWWEKSEDNGLSWKKASRLLIGKSRQVHTLVVATSLRMNGYKYRVVTIEPKIKYSNMATLYVIQPTTTTTTTTTFSPITTTLPPCDLQIIGSGDNAVTTTSTPTTTTPSSTTTTAAPIAGQAYFVNTTIGYGGKYCEDGTYNGKSKYKNQTNTYYYIYYDITSGTWHINNFGDLGVANSDVYSTITSNTPPTGSSSWVDNQVGADLGVFNNFYTTDGYTGSSYTFINYGSTFNSKPLYMSLDGSRQIRYNSGWIIEDISGDPDNPFGLWSNSSNSNTPPTNGWSSLTSAPSITLVGPTC